MSSKTVIISGSRTLVDYTLFERIMQDQPFVIHHVHVGDSKGIDALALRWCQEKGITYTRFRANWGFYGRSAGPERNQEMINFGGEALISIWVGDAGRSKGSADMLRRAKKHNLPIYEVIVDDDGELQIHHSVGTKVTNTRYTLHRVED